MKLFLLIGQSNMAGRGELNELPEITDRRCKMLRNGRFQPMHEPIVFDRPLNCLYHSGTNLAASFAKAYAEIFDEEVGLIPCADGGTTLARWQPGEILYDHAVFLARLGMRSGELAGILWHQGEAECSVPERASTYAERFLPIITQMKEDVGCPGVPVLMGELGYYLSEFGDGHIRYWKVVNEQLHKIADENPGFAVVSAAGLAPKADGLHFSTASLRTFGERYFRAYRKLTGR